MAYARKTPGGRWRGVAKSGRVVIGTKTHDRRRDAIAWAERVEATAAGGVDVRAGQVRVRDLLREWVELRRRTVAPKTAVTDADLLRLMAPTLGARAVGSVLPIEIERWLLYLRERHGLADGSLRRYRQSLSSFFAWTVAEHRRSDNPVTTARLPAPLDPPREMRPMTEEELNGVVAAIRRCSPAMADLVVIAGWTGLRWGELRALRVRTVQHTPAPALHVVASQTEGKPEKVAKGRNRRRVPLADVAHEAVLRAAAGKGPNDRLLGGPDGGSLWRRSFLRATGWEEVSGGRRLHDLRHTAACLWLSRGVDLATVSAWLGHASVSTTNIYLHHLGTSADAAGLALLNGAGGARGVRDLREDC